MIAKQIEGYLAYCEAFGLNPSDFSNLQMYLSLYPED